MSYEIDNHQILSSEEVFGGRIISVLIDRVSLPDGRVVSWERVTHPGAVGMVPVLDDGRIMMVRQYRNATDGILLEIPAGKLSKGEAPEDCAARELVEEVGFKAGELIKLSEFYNSPGYSDEYFHIYLARKLEPAEGTLDPDEFIEKEIVSFSDAFRMISDGSIRDAKTIIGVSLASFYKRGEIDGFKNG